MIFKKKPKIEVVRPDVETLDLESYMAVSEQLNKVIPLRRTYSSRIGKYVIGKDTPLNGFGMYRMFTKLPTYTDRQCRSGIGSPIDYSNEKVPFIDEEKASLVTSYLGEISGTRYHAPAIDIDLPVQVRTSSYGKSHLFIDVALTQDKYWKLLDCLAEIGIVEPGYAEASKNVGHSALRMPDIPKDVPQDESILKRKEKLMEIDPVRRMKELIKDKEVTPELTTPEQSTYPIPVF